MKLKSLILISIFTLLNVHLLGQSTKIDLTQQVQKVLPIANGGTGNTSGASATVAATLTNANTTEYCTFVSGDTSSNYPLLVTPNNCTFNPSTGKLSVGSVSAQSGVSGKEFGLGPSPLTADDTCTSGMYWLAPVLGSVNTWRECNNGTLSNIGGGSMVYPGAGVAVSTGSGWGTSLTAPSGALVGTTDTQTLTNKTVDGVSPTTMGYMDATSSVQTQLNSKGAGTLTAVSVATANGVSGTSSGGATPALTIALGAITPTSVAASAGLTATSDGVHAGIASLVGNTTNPSLPSNSFGWLAPLSASFTSYFLQPGTTAPASNFLQCAAPSAGVSTCSWASPSTGTLPHAIVFSDMSNVVYGNSAVVGIFYSPVAGTIPAGGTGTYNSIASTSYCNLITAATASTTFTIKQGASSVGTVAFGVSGSTGTFTISSPVSVASADKISITAPASADATAAGLNCSIVFSY